MGPMAPPDNWRELAGLDSTPELFADSPLWGRVVFVPGRHVGTAVFTRGITRLVGNYGVTKVAGRVGGVSALVDDDRFLRATRALVDDLLGAETARGVVVEHVAGDVDRRLLNLLYPDASIGQSRRRRGRKVGEPEAAASPLTNRVVFILGCFRSGTTWLEHLLLAHPSASGLDGRESWVFEGLADLWLNITEGPLSAVLPPGAGARAERRFVDAVLGGFRDANHPEATHVIEKSPVHNNHVAHMAAVYPDARYVNIVRDGRDVARSLMEVGDGTDAVAGAHIWATAVRNVRRDADLVPRLRELRYEALVADPVGEVTALLEWIGLPVDESVRAELEQRSAHHVSKRNTTGRPGAGKWREELSSEQVGTIERIAGDELRAYGYV